MALSPPVEREHLHTRKFDFRGYRRSDGLWDIEGHMTDAKTYSFPNEWRGGIARGEPIHDMWIRLTLDDDFIVRDIEVVTAAGPFRTCPAITPNFAVVKGERVAPGWHRRIRQLLGGVKGCTHQLEMLGALATVAFQTIYPAMSGRGDASAEERRPPHLDTCHALASDGEVVKRFWPRYYTGE
jgi:hypothetical protein